MYDIDIFTNKYAINHVFRTEFSSIFLCLSQLMNKHSPHKILNTLCSLALFVTFFKYRIYDFYVNVIGNEYFYDSIKTNDEPIQIIYKYSATYLFYGLNMYWFSLMLKFLYKSLRLNINYHQVESCLKYSYFMCLLSTIYSYSAVCRSAPMSKYPEFHVQTSCC